MLKVQPQFALGRKSPEYIGGNRVNQLIFNYSLQESGVKNRGSSLRLTFEIFQQESNVDLTPNSPVLPYKFYRLMKKKGVKA